MRTGMKNKGGKHDDYDKNDCTLAFSEGAGKYNIRKTNFQEKKYEHEKNSIFISYHNKSLNGIYL